jgi:translation initiation factor 1
MSGKKSELVYSTDRVIPRKGKAAEKRHPVKESVGQRLTVRHERKGRGGKSVTLIEGLQMPQKEKEDLLKQFKIRLGTGGTIKESTIEIQGDHADALVEALGKMGHRPKRSGG